ncbi:Glutaminyl-tRNA synthetase [Dimargaris cristalligena]|uniref:glutamine--tRNA ligase n=1 Tax=Dimargaris cristalligena TaxID=215637 RepID=A0A4P9ZYZ3_9FUNG|nr:Glutaminyl-tRNA synthetase [Dimargaris cristalligena]RKP38907.1 tRNA synthetases class I, catalytic domain-containing protein [Dimargaris cristalligena]|eukprot:RKP38907.1 tRNA synthetases class I, catalytic domain-containing protein [Dimargaris cristalligena]
MDDLVVLFTTIGLSEQKAQETAKNKKLAPALASTIRASGLTDGIPDSTGKLLYRLASTVTPKASAHLEALAQTIGQGQLASNEQVDAAIKYCEAQADPLADRSAFDRACGIGVTVTDAEIENAIRTYFETNQERLVKDRYRALGPLLGGLKKVDALKWASPAKVKAEFDAQVLATIGPKDERDEVVKTKGKEGKKGAAAPASKGKNGPAAESTTPAANPDAIFFEGDISKLHRPGGNPQVNPRLIEEHLKATGGKVVTRFPPEPNGFLHIGHAKAINVNFGFAKAHDGVCYLRYDDTNPEAEEEQYFTSILETVKWLGFTPFQITYSSDNFQRLYELAIELIKRDKAYVCHCTGEEIKAHRGGEAKGPRSDCVHRSRPIAESLAEFQKMKDGRYGEGEAILRMKMNMQDGNPQFWDLVAYRVLNTPHHRTGSKWCIYPTYDYTHCLCDSFENITHSLCTTEFRQSRESYYWLCDALEVYKPVQWEYGRLNVTNTVLSKRKLLKLVQAGLVSGWDDPRLYTLPALRRRGVPPQAINQFVREVGITTSTSTIEVERLDNQTRAYLDEHAPRLMAVVKPLRITLTNVPADQVTQLTLPFKPRCPAMGEHTVPFSRDLFIDASDFRMEDAPDYFRLAKGKTVGLLHVPHPITCDEVECNEAGEPVHLQCRYLTDLPAGFKPKAYIQWVANCPTAGSPVAIDELRVYDRLFRHNNPLDKNEVPQGWLSDIDTNSLHRTQGALVEVGIWDAIRRWAETTPSLDLVENLRFQFIRIGYFALDKDSQLPAEAALQKADPKACAESAKLVFNRIVTLRESGKKEA